MFKKLSSKVVIEHPRFTLIEDEVKIPTGKKIFYLRFQNKGNGTTLICKKGNMVLLQREYSYPPNEILYQFPGGFVPKDENIELGANRELMEESNYRSKKLTLLGSYFTNNRSSNEKMYVYLAEDLEKKVLKSDESEDIENFWFKEEQIDKMIKNGEIVNSTVLAAWSLYKLKAKSSF